MPGMMKGVDLICSQFSPVKMKLNITLHDIYKEAVFLSNIQNKRLQAQKKKCTNYVSRYLQGLSECFKLWRF